MIALLAIVFAAVAFLAIRSARNQGGSAALPGRDYVPAPVENLPPPPAKPKKEAPSVPIAAVAPAIPAGDSLQFQVRATQPVWVSIAPDGIPAYRGQMSTGEVRSFKAGQKFVIDIGNQKSVAMTFDGAPLSGLPAIQNSSVVVRNLVLTRDRASLGGNAVDWHLLTTPPTPPAPKPTVSSVPPPVPPPAIAKKMESLAKNAHASVPTSNRKNPNPDTPTKPESHSAHGNRSTVAKHKKSATITIPTEPIRPVNPIPPGP